MTYFYFRPENIEPRVEFSDPNRKSGWKELLLRFLQSKRSVAAAIFIILMIVSVFCIFRYDDYENSCHIKIGLSLIEWNNLKIKRALAYLRENSPEDYRNTCNYVERISPDLPCGGTGGGCFRPQNRKQIEISTLGHKNNSAYTAAVIAHETCHSIQKEEGRPLNEEECYSLMSQLLKKFQVTLPRKSG